MANWSSSTGASRTGRSDATGITSSAVANVNDPFAVTLRFPDMEIAPRMIPEMSWRVTSFALTTLTVLKLLLLSIWLLMTTLENDG